MFCYQCEETIGCTGCTKVGVCGKSGNVADLQDKLILVVKLVAKNGEKNEVVDKFIMESLFSTVTNVNFTESFFLEKIEEGKKLANINDNSELEKFSILSEENEDIRSLKEITTYGLKGLAAYLDHAYILGYKDQTIFDFVRSALITLTEDKSIDELIALVLECGEFSVKTMALLDKANTESYGTPEPTSVNIGVSNKPGILISGHDLKDMKELLEQTKDSGVDVYTHGEMLAANAYPEFKKYPHFIGNYGGAWWSQANEFEKFNGPILMTTNCIVPPRKSYINRIFTTSLVGFDGVKHIDNGKDGKQKDFSQIIELAKTCNAPTEIETGEIMTGFAHTSALSVADKIVDAVKNGKIKKFIVMAGCDGRRKEREYYTEFAKKLPKDTVILTAGCAKYRYNKLDLGDIDGIPRILDAGQCNDSYSLVVIAQKLAEVFELDDINKLPIVYNIAWYEQKAVTVLLALLYLGVKNIRLGPKLPAFISPTVLNVLIENFNIGGITNVEDDINNLILN